MHQRFRQDIEPETAVDKDEGESASIEPWMDDQVHLAGLPKGDQLSNQAVDPKTRPIRNQDGTKQKYGMQNADWRHGQEQDSSMKAIANRAAMQNGDLSALRQRLAGLSALSYEEDEFLTTLESVNWALPAGALIAEEGQASNDAFIVNSGWAIRYKSLEDGSRMIIDFLLPGDIANVGTILSDVAEYSVSTLTQVSVSPITRENVAATLQHFPKLALAMMCLLARDKARLVERLLNIARRPARQRLAHLMTELMQRQRVVSHGHDRKSVLPISQIDLADSLGLTTVHVNRVLRRMRERDLIQLRRGEVEVTDAEGLRAIARFDGRYLNMPIRAITL